MRLKIELWYVLFPLIILEMFLHLDLSPPVLNSIDWTLFGKANTCLYKVQQLTVHVRAKNQAVRSKELSVELRDRIVSRHRSGEWYHNISAALKVPKNTVASIILKWKTFGATKTLPRAGRPAKLSNRGRRALVREVTQ
uniref:Sleeping Beauty transposase HTH domain-containing protein n=1 Tax=Oncorhynchus tshawytscha TaxID=74940 RepID=A0AAZ3P7K7_ONCTS